MKSNVNIKVRVGKVLYDAVKTVWESTDAVLADNGDSVLVNVPKGTTADDVVMLLNYAHDLKVRAKVTSAQNPTGVKTANRATAQQYVLAHMADETAGDFDRFIEINSLMATHKASQKDLNAWLDEMYEKYVEPSTTVELPSGAEVPVGSPDEA